MVASPADLAERVAGVVAARRGLPGPGRYDFAKSWRGTASRFPTTPTPCTGSPRGISARLRRPGEAGGAGPLSPIYLRPPDAVRWRERDTVQTAE